MDTDISEILVKELRYSMVWVSLITKGGIFRKQSDYYNEFKKAGSNIGDWSVPWTETPHVVFWEKYIEKAPLINKAPVDNNGTNTCVLDFQKATGCVVPLRAKDLCPIKLMDDDQTAQQDLSVWSEGFAYPHGVACIITLRWRSKNGLKLNAMVDRLIDLRNGFYHWANANAPLYDGKGATIDEISRKILSHLSNKSKGEALGDSNEDPFTVATVVEAENAPLAELAADSLLHKSLDALCTLNRNWRYAKTSNLSNASLKPTERNNKNDVLYARSLGRAVWLPVYFRQHRSPAKRKSIQYLGRYHRNLTFATMQTAYLSLFLKWVNGLHRELTGDEENWARAAAGAIARLYGPCRKSYKSMSLPEQILPFKDAIDAVRAKFIPNGELLGQRRAKQDNGA